MARSRYSLTEAKLEKWRSQGRGQGRGVDYRPWLTINDFASRGLTSRVRSATAGRMHTFFSKIELGVFLEADWHAGVFDIREQFPLPRPDTIAIAEAMGVRHPRVGPVDIVMTTDLLLDVAATANAPAGLVAVTCKPAKELDDDRILEKLEIERRYWATRQVPLRIVTELEVSEPRVLTLSLLADRRSFEGCVEPRPGYWREVCGVIVSALPCSEDRTLAEVMVSLEAAHDWAPGDGITGLLHLAANRLVPIDLEVGFDPRKSIDQVGAPSKSSSCASAVAA